MTREAVLRWLEGRRPSRPAELDARMTHVVSACVSPRLAEAATMADALGVVGLEMLHCVAGSPDPQAEGLALDLLAADAFVTYAFEAAAEDGVPAGPLVERMLQGAA